MTTLPMRSSSSAGSMCITSRRTGRMGSFPTKRPPARAMVGRFPAVAVPPEPPSEPTPSCDHINRDAGECGGEAREGQGNNQTRVRPPWTLAAAGLLYASPRHSQHNLQKAILWPLLPFNSAGGSHEL